MRHIYLLLVFLLIGYFTSYSQSKFGNATKEELQMTSYEGDETADAVILNKEGELNFKLDDRKGFQFEYTEKVKIKILNTDGLKYANQEIDYFGVNKTSLEEVIGLSATAYNLENGKVIKTKMGKENVFEEDTEEKWKKIKFTIPAAKVGSVIEYKYTLVSPYMYELRDFYFQEEIPVVHVSYEAVIPEYFNYNIENRGYVSLDKADIEPVRTQFRINIQGGTGRGASGMHECGASKYIFKASNVVAAKPENHLWSIRDYISMVSFELRSTNIPGEYFKAYTSSWDKVDSELMKGKTFGGNLKHAGWFKDEITKVGTPTIEEATKIRDVIKNKVKWNEKNSFYPGKLEDALEKGVGSSAEINFLLINALKAGGFDAYPVILSTRAKGRLPIVHPSVLAFNYTITGLKIDSTLYYIDASDKYSSWNLLPQKCMVPLARALRDNSADWVDLSTVTAGTVHKRSKVIFKDGQVINEIKEVRRGNDAYNARRVLDSYDSQDKFVESIEEKGNCSVEDFIVKGVDDIDALFQNEYIEKRDIDLSDDFIYFTPPISKLYTENPFKAETRTYPINFNYQQNYVHALEIEIPEGYEIAEIPAPERIVMPDNNLVYTYSIVKQNGKVIINSRYQVKNLMYLPTDYEGLKELFSRMILKNDEQIVFKKITEQANIESNEAAKTI